MRRLQTRWLECHTRLRLRHPRYIYLKRSQKSRRKSLGSFVRLWDLILKESNGCRRMKMTNSFKDMDPFLKTFELLSLLKGRFLSFALFFKKCKGRDRKHPERMRSNGKALRWRQLCWIVSNASFWQ